MTSKEEDAAPREQQPDQSVNEESIVAEEDASIIDEDSCTCLNEGCDNKADPVKWRNLFCSSKCCIKSCKGAIKQWVAGKNS